MAVYSDGEALLLLEQAMRAVPFPWRSRQFLCHRLKGCENQTHYW